MAQDQRLHLWRAVVAAGLRDEAKENTGWIGSADFVTVCHLAQIDPAAVLRAYQPERFTRLGKVA